MKLTITNPMTKLSATITTSMMAASAAQAQQNVAGMANSVSANIYAVTDIISTMSYLLGAAFAMAGVMSLKKHAENASQEPIGKGVGRIAAGAALGALPFIINTAFNSMGVNETQGVGVSGELDRF